mgnify:CR=1 FL=1
MPSSLEVNTILPFSTDNVFIGSSLRQGAFNNANGTKSHAEGQSTDANGDYSHTEGYDTTANGHRSHAEGYGTTTEGLYSHAEGRFTTANGESSHAEGFQTNASGLYSHAEGVNTISSGYVSHAEGSATESSGNYSHAEGFQTNSSGLYSHAEGFDTTASGINSHAEGRGTIASGDYSHAEGYDTIASGDYSNVVGKFNLEDTTAAAFIIGNGLNNLNRSNLLLAAANQVEVFGKTKTETIQISDGAVDGYVLTSDALGNGTWQAIPAGATDTFVTGASLNGTDLEIDRNQGEPQITVDLSSLVTPPGIDTFVTAAALNGTVLEIDRNQGQPQITVDLASINVDLFVTSGSYDVSTSTITLTRNNGVTLDITGVTDTYATGLTLNGNILELSRNQGLSTLTADLSAFAANTFVTSGAYDGATNTITLTRNDGGTVDVTGIADSYVTGAVLNGSTLELARNEGLPTLSVDLSSLLDVTTSTVDSSADPSANTDVVFYSAGSAGGTIYLGTAIAGKKVTLIRTSTTAAADIAGSGGALVNGAAIKALPTTVFSATTCISDGTNWYCNDGDPL